MEITRPAGTFLLREGEGPVIGFAGGSGITPLLSIAKSTLATTDRDVRLLIADRDRNAAIFDAVTDELVEKYAGRLTVLRHFDDDLGLLTPASALEFIGADTASDAYLCGPEAFMDMIESAHTGPGTVYSERFGAAAEPVKAAEEEIPAPAAPIEGTVSIRLGSQRVSVPLQAGETLLESARRAGLAPPFSCEAGNCATCIAKITDGSATMRVNDALSDDEIADGYTLTCQAVPDCSIKVRYE